MNIGITTLREQFFLYTQNKVLGYLTLLVFLVPLSVLPNLSSGTNQFIVIKIGVFYSLLGAAIFCLPFNKTSKRVSKPLVLAFVLFFLGGLLSLIFSVDFINTIIGTPFRWIGLMFYIGLAVLALGLASNLDKDRVKFFLNVIILAGLINSILALFQTFGFGYYDSDPQFGALYRAPGMIGNPNFLAIYLITIIPFAAGLFLVSPGTRAKLYYGISTFLMIWCVIFLQSRGGILGLGVALLLLFGLFQYERFSRKSKKWSALFVLVFVLLFYLFGSLVRPSSFSEALSRADNNTFTRMVAADISIQAISDRPLVGYGLGNYQYAFHKYSLSGLGGYFDDAHNLYLHMGATGGLIFLAGFLLINSLALVKALRKALSGSEDNWVGIAAFSGLFGFLLSANFNPIEASDWVMWAALVGLSFYGANEKFYSVNFSKIWIVIGSILIIYGFYFVATDSIAYVSAHRLYQGDYEGAGRWLKLNLPFNPNDYIFDYHKIKLHIATAENEDDKRKIPMMIDVYGANHVNYSSTYIAKGVLYFILYRNDKKEETFIKAVENMKKGYQMNPFFGGVQYRLVDFYINKGDYVNAEKYSKENLINNKEDYISWIQLVNIYHLADKKDMVIKTLKTTAKTGSNTAIKKRHAEHLADTYMNNPAELEKYLSTVFSVDVTANYPY